MKVTRPPKRPHPKSALCLWMQAGVVSRRYCTTNFDCMTCRFDRALRRAAETDRRHAAPHMPGRPRRARIIFWKDRLRQLPHGRRPCLHHMKGHIDFKACTHDYRCGNCEFDQFFYDEFRVHTLITPVSLLDIHGVKLPQGLYLHPGHTWIKVEEGGEARIGLDDFARRLLGPPTRIRAPLVGKKLARNRADIQLRRGAYAAGICSPLSGVVTAINPGPRDAGLPVHQNPYSQGWIARVHSDTLRQDLKRLMIGKEAGDFLRKEIDLLYRVIETRIGPLATDGGQLGNDIFGSLPRDQWNRLATHFLRT